MNAQAMLMRNSSVAMPSAVVGRLRLTRPGPLTGAAAGVGAAGAVSSVAIGGTLTPR